MKIVILLSLLILLIGIGFVSAEEVRCSSNSDCGEVSTSFFFCKNETHICTTTKTPTCNNATTNVSSCKDVRKDTCWVCKNGCENRACLEVEVCDSDNLNLCLNEIDCTDASGYWYNTTCNEEEQVIKTKDDEDNNETNGGNGLGQIIRNRVKAGVYTSPTGEQIRVSELAQNRLLLKFDEEDVDAETELEIQEETQNNKTKLKAKLSNGREAEIKIMPGVAAERALERLRLKVCSSENNCSIELKEVGNKLTYELQAERHAKILAMFRARMQVKAQVDAETGEVIRIGKPWWAFLATEPEE